jgi:hypothetical protein
MARRLAPLSGDRRYMAIESMDYLWAEGDKLLKAIDDRLGMWRWNIFDSLFIFLRNGLQGMCNRIDDTRQLLASPV